MTTAFCVSDGLFLITKEFLTILGSKVDSVLHNYPLKAMDTILVDGNEIVISPDSSGGYLVECSTKTKTRKMTVVLGNKEKGNPFPTPKKFLDSMGILV